MNMKQYIVKIQSIKHITHDVLQLVTERPKTISSLPDKLLTFPSTNPIGRIKPTRLHLQVFPKMIFWSLA